MSWSFVWINIMVLTHSAFMCVFALWFFMLYDKVTLSQRRFSETISRKILLKVINRNIILMLNLI